MLNGLFVKWPPGPKVRIAILTAIIIICIILYNIYSYFEQNRISSTFYGQVDIRSVETAFRVSGRLQTMAVDEGDSVKQGQLLATLDGVPYQLVIDEVQAELDAQKAVVTKLTNGLRPEEILQAQAQFSSAQADFTNATRELDRIRLLTKQHFLAKQDFDNADARYKQAQASLAIAQQGLMLALKGTRSEDVNQALAILQSLQAKLAQAKQQLVDTNLYAPSQGIIQIRLHEPGTVLQAGAPVYVLTISDPVWVWIWIPERALAVIKPGQAVTVKHDGPSAQELYGRVGYISPIAEFTPKYVQTEDLRADLVYRVRLLIADPNHLLKQGMPVTIHVAHELNNG